MSIIVFFMFFACSKDEIATNENTDDTSENTDSSDESNDNNSIDTADWSLITHRMISIPIIRKYMMTTTQLEE